MTPDQEAHLKRVIDQFNEKVSTKYRAGQAEHGGNLWLKTGMVDKSIEEVLDLVVYLLTLKEQIVAQRHDLIEGESVDKE